MLHRTLLTFPSLYRTWAVFYETNIGPAVGELLAQIDQTFYTAEQFRGARFGIEHVIERYQSEIAEHKLLQRLYYIRKS